MSAIWVPETIMRAAQAQPWESAWRPLMSQQGSLTLDTILQPPAESYVSLACPASRLG